MHSIRRRASDEDEHRKASWLIRFVWLSPVLPGWAVNPPLLAQERDSMRFSSASNPSQSRPAHDSGKNLTEGPSPPLHDRMTTRRPSHFEVEIHSRTRSVSRSASQWSSS